MSYLNPMRAKSIRIHTLFFLILLATFAIRTDAQTVINFDNLPNGTIVTNQYSQVTFSSIPVVMARMGAATFGSSPPNYICAGVSTSTCVANLDVRFTDPVNDLKFVVVRLHNGGPAGSIDVFENDKLSSTVNISGAGPLVPIDLKAFKSVTRILVKTGPNSGGLGFDDFSFTTGQCTVQVTSTTDEFKVMPLSPPGTLASHFDSATKPPLKLKVLVKDNKDQNKTYPNPTLEYPRKAIANSGHHNHHDDDRPTGRFTRSSAPIASDGSFQVEYTPPDVSGEVEFQVKATIEGGAVCSSSPQKIEVKVPLLVELPNSEGPFKLVGTTSTHPSPTNHFGTAQLREALIRLAFNYHQKYGQQLSFNDMSLPWGGRFDVGENPWKTPHAGHTFGIHADLRIRNGLPDGPGLPRDAALRLDLIKMARDLNLGVLIEGNPPHWHFIYGEPGCRIKGSSGVACDERTVLLFTTESAEEAAGSAPNVNMHTLQDANTGLFTYQYTFTNAASSSVEISSIQIHLNNSAIFNVQAPQGWTGRAWHDGSAVDFTATQVTTPPGYTDEGNLVPSPFQIKPGQNLTGFSFQSFDPPGIVNFTAQEFKQIPSLNEGSTAPPPSMFDNSFKGTTQGPTKVSSNLNKIDDADSFVRQHYLDFLNREPDIAGFQFWTEQINECGSNAGCREVKRVNVSAAYFLSIEFQETGYLIYRLNKTSFGTMPKYTSFVIDTGQLGRDVIVGTTGWETKLENNKKALIEAWVNRSNFKSLYAGKTNAQYVAALVANTGVTFSQAEINSLVNGLVAGTETRTTVLRKVAENSSFSRKEFNSAFVLMQYFGYLRRDPDSGPDTNLNGFTFWLNKLNQFGGNFVQAEMVKAFISSIEYRQRFVQP